MSDVPSPDEIINGGKKSDTPVFVRKDDGTITALSDEQRVALSIIMRGMPFVIIGINPTENGADFHRALHGPETDLRNARPFLDEQISKAYRKREIV